MKKLLPFLLLICCAPKDARQEFSENLDKFFSNQFPAGDPGGAVLVMQDTTIIYSKALGLADLVTKEPISTKTLFNVGSISKTLTCNAILILQEQGKLSVEDSVWKYFPTFKNKDIAQKVKIKHLLTHTSGLPDNRQVEKDSLFYLTANDAQNWYPITQTDTLEFEPGTKYNYSNPSYNALALIIEQITGQKWQQFVGEKIFMPAGMTTSTITDGAHPQSGVSHAYTKIVGQWREDDFGEEPTFCASGNGGVWSSVEELAKYEIAIRKAVFLKRETITESRTIKNFPHWLDPTPPTRGWSWDVQNIGGLKTAEHTGHQGGFAANYISIPEKKIFFVVLYNAPYDVYLFREKVISFLNEGDWLE